MVLSLNGRGSRDYQTVTLDTLPDEFKKQFQAAYENYKRTYANTKSGQAYLQPGSQPPP
jgi:hypothetical protein